MGRTQTSAEPKASEPFVYLSHKMSPEFHDWLHKLAEKLGLPLSSTIDTALMRLAAESGVGAPPPRIPHRRRRRAS